ncbi:response regulator [Nostocoides vanveenii]|uniref:Uncharacterized protein n=1 Tax=Nostocoides vanveenii TaxID=330835 RepID=A0ABP4X1R8_9MICO
MLLAGMRRRLLNAAHRWLFGGTDDPFAVVRAVGEQMDASLDPAETLRRSPDAVARALRLPYAAIVLRHNGSDTVFAEYGRRLVEPVNRPLVAGGLTLGRLEVSPRRHGQQLSTTEDRLVATVAVHAARVAEAHLLSLAVLSARERLVLAREDESLRLRNDLHDGLGPLLAGARMQLAAARHSADSQRRADLVDRAATDLGTATTSVRELVDGLRPAALDDGLVAALDSAVHALLPDRSVVIEVPGPLPALSAGVEIAAFRIVAEAATNIARHAPSATRCTIQLLAGQPADALVLDVADDGPGIVTRSAGSGVGQASMRASRGARRPARGAHRPGRDPRAGCASRDARDGRFGSLGRRDTTTGCAVLPVTPAANAPHRRREPAHGRSGSGTLSPTDPRGADETGAMTPEAAPSTLVVDDHPVVRRRLVALLEGEAWAGTIREAASVGEALSLLHAAPPTVAVVDLRLPDGAGTAVIRALTAYVPGCRSVVLTMEADARLVRSALDAGATGYLLKDAPPEELLDGLRAAAAGGVVLGGGSLRPERTGHRWGGPFRHLSPREVRISGLVATRAINPDIAARLGISEKTVRNQVSAIAAKLGTSGRVGITILAREHHLVTGEDH